MSRFLGLRPTLIALAVLLVALGAGIAMHATRAHSCTPWHYDTGFDADPAYWADFDAHVRAGWTSPAFGSALAATNVLIPPGCRAIGS